MTVFSNRRDVLRGMGVLGTSGTFDIPTQPSLDAIQGSEFVIEDVIAHQTIKAPHPDESVPIISQVRNTGEVEREVEVTLLAGSRDSIREEPNNTNTVTIPPKTAVPVDFDLEGPQVSTEADIVWDVRFRLGNPSTRQTYTTTGVKSTITYNSHFKPIKEILDRESQLQVMGGNWGDWGSENEIPGAKSLSYFAGWLASSFIPVAELAVDVRDCNVRNDAQWENVLDCGGAALNGFGTATTAAGLAGISAVFEPVSTAGGGLMVVVGSAVTLGENVTDVARVSGEFLTAFPDMVKPVTRWLRRVYDQSFVSDVARKVEDDFGFRDVGEGLRKANVNLLEIKDAKFTDDPVVLSSANYATEKSNVAQAHIKPWMGKYLDKDGIERVARNAERGWEGTTEGGETVRLLVQRSDSNRYDIIVLRKEPEQWDITNAWDSFSSSFLKDQKQKLDGIERLSD